MPALPTSSAHLPAAFPLLLSLSDPLRAAARGWMELRGDSRGVEHREEVADVQQGPCLPPWQALSSLPSSPRGEGEGDARERSGSVQGDAQGMLRGYSRNAQGDAQEGVEHPAVLCSTGIIGLATAGSHRSSGFRQLRGGDGVAKRVPAPPGTPRAAAGALRCTAAAPAPLSPGGMAQGMLTFTLLLLQARLRGRRAG